MLSTWVVVRLKAMAFESALTIVAAPVENTVPNVVVAGTVKHRAGIGDRGGGFSAVPAA